MHTVLEHIGSYAVLRIDSGLEYLSDVQALERELQALVEDGETNIAVDFSPVFQFQTKSVAFLLYIAKHLQASRGKLCFFGINEEFGYYLDLLDLHPLVEIFATEADFRARHGL